MKNKIEILCPGKHCPRCRRMIRYMEQLISENQWDAEIIIITGLKDFLKFNTWILPSVYVNGVKVSRGYRPRTKDIIHNLK